MEPGDRNWDSRIGILPKCPARRRTISITLALMAMVSAFAAVKEAVTGDGDFQWTGAICWLNIMIRGRPISTAIPKESEIILGQQPNLGAAWRLLICDHTLSEIVLSNNLYPTIGSH